MYPDFVDLLRDFTDAGVRFLIVGAHAVAVHARPRATGDLDLWIDPSPENAAAAYAALIRFGAPLDSLQPSDLAEDDVVFQIGVAPVRIDILTGISGVAPFDEALTRSVSATIGGCRVFVLGLDDLIANKRASGRAKDRLDLARLKRAKRRRRRSS